MTTPVQPFAIPVPESIRAWADDFARASYRERLKLSGQPSCRLCGARVPFGREHADVCTKCGAQTDAARARLAYLLGRAPIEALTPASDDETFPI